MAASTVIKHFTDGSITLTDGTAVTPITLVIPFTQGDLSITGLQQNQNDVVAYQTRGVLHSVRHAAANFPTGSLSFMVADYSDGTDQTAIDFLLKQASYSANVTTLTNSTEVYALDILLTVEGTDHGDSADATISLSQCACTLDITEGEPNTVSVNFTMYGPPTFT
jgi:hypothetical protein